jgi:hypothetical protein
LCAPYVNYCTPIIIACQEVFLWYSFSARESYPVQGMNKETGTGEKQNNPEDYKGDAKSSALPHTINSDAADEKTKKHERETDEEMNRLCEKVAFAYKWVRQHCRWLESKIWKGVTALGTIAAVLAASVYAGIAAYQFFLVRDTEQRQLRAYLLPDGATVEFSKDGTYSVRVQITNFGQTPAYTVNRWMAAAIEGKMDPPFDYYTKNGIKVGQVRPDNVDLGNGQSVCITIKNVPFNPRQTAAKQEAIYVRGIIRYWDGFQRCQFDAFILQSISSLGGAPQQLRHVINWATDTPSANRYYEKCALGQPPPSLNTLNTQNSRYFDELPTHENDSVMDFGKCPSPTPN